MIFYTILLQTKVYQYLYVFSSAFMKGGVFLYKKYKELLKINELTSYKVSKETDISESVLSSWKNGISTPNLTTLMKLSKYFKVPVDYFLEDK